MSKWYEAKLENITVSEDKKELEIWFDSDYEGNNYLSVKIEDIQQVLGSLKCKI